MRVIALVSLALTLSVSSLPVSDTLGTSDVSSLGDKVKSTIGSASNSASHGLRSLTDGAGAPGLDTVNQLIDELTGGVGSQLGGDGSPLGGAGSSLGGAGSSLGGVGSPLGTPPLNRRGTGPSDVVNTVKGDADNTEDKAEGEASGAQSKATGVLGKAPGAPAGVPRNVVPAPPSGDVAGRAKNVVDKVKGTLQGAASKLGAGQAGAPGVSGLNPSA